MELQPRGSVAAAGCTHYLATIATTSSTSSGRGSGDVGTTPCSRNRYDECGSRDALALAWNMRSAPLRTYLQGAGECECGGDAAAARDDDAYCETGACI